KHFGHPLIPGSNTEIELLSNSGETRVVELRGRETEWEGKTVLLASFRDITERKRAEERIYTLAYYDELTGLPNRRLFYDRLEQVTDRCAHFGGGGVVFLVDVTRLREVNDTLGQQAGDDLIREIAQRISDTVSEKDTVSRASGGEFMVLSNEKSTDEKAYAIGVCILERIGHKIELSGRFVYPEVNIGFCLFPDRGTDPDTLIKQADLALSEAKKNPHRIIGFSGQEDWISREFHLEHDLKQALATEEFFLYYQPQVDLRSGSFVGLEALLRWEHPEKGVISPGEFIPMLESTGLIASADAWVIHNVCKQLKCWQDGGIFMKTAVNLSYQDFNDDEIIEVIRNALEENNLQAGSLEVEITETGLMENVERTARILQTFSGWGVGVALDDFGTGYSSLSYLHKLPLNIIKIDKGFVDGLPDNKDSVTLVHTIIAMAHNMGKEVLAEGVEREGQRQKLCELGCDYGQGFLWSRPQPAESLALLER
ncbi:MAG: EAL domain-containing protein, partial [Desulfovermiculus sp.]